MSYLQYTTVMKVYESWAIIKGADHVVAAEAIYTRLFELFPQAKVMLNFGSTKGGSSSSLVDDHQVDIKTSPTFLLHVRALFDMLDLAVNSLGPDLEPLADELVELGKRHRGRGVQPDHLVFMEQAFVEGISNVLRERSACVDATDHEAWREVFQFLTNNMAAGLTGSDAA